MSRDQTSCYLKCCYSCDDELPTYYSSKFALCYFIAAESVFTDVVMGILQAFHYKTYFQSFIQEMLKGKNEQTAID